MDNFTTQRILDAARIEDVVADFVELTKKGPRYLGLCPFHDDHHLGSFVVYPRMNCFRCFTCDAKGDPAAFLMKHLNISFPDAVRWLGKKYGIDTGSEVTFQAPLPRPAPPPLPMLELPWDMVTAREHTEDDTLCFWMRQLPWDKNQQARIEDVLKAYHIGHSTHGHTIFWQIDEQNRVRTGKMMLYLANGHRNKVAKWNFDFIHACLFRDPKLPQWDDKKQELKQTLFGMHLLDRYGPDATVRIVESEKTAVLLAIAYGNNKTQVWMACGGLENLSSDRLAPIISRHRRIVLYPDRDGIDRWTKKATQLNYDRLSVNTQPVTDWWQPSDGDKADFADIVIRMIQDYNNNLTT